MTIKATALAIVATLGTAGFAAADSNALFADNTYAGGSNFTIDLVRSAGSGTVDVYAFNGGVQGDLLGSAPVNAGANADVKIDLGTTPRNDILAVLSVNGAVVDAEAIDVVN